MKVLIIGSGGREHALAWKMAQSPKVDAIYCAPGNPGIAQHAECVPLQVDDLDGITAFAAEKRIDLAVIGPEAPLVLGLTDRLEAGGVLVFGPSARAAELEGSKAFAKSFMARHGIPTARYREFSEPETARAYVHEQRPPFVIKADGLAAGKGVTVAHDVDTALRAIDAAMEERVFGDAGSRIIIEEFLEGEEASILAFCDGREFLVMETSQDHKPAYEGDEGPNTGGMGAYSPAPVVTPELFDVIGKRILEPCVSGMAEEDRPYKGVLYAGLMITNEGPKVVEFNCRFGDPEIQAILPRMQSDLAPLLQASAEGSLEGQTLDWRDEACVTVVMASGGYPGPYTKGKVIEGIAEAERDEQVVVFHAGTKAEAGTLQTAGGRVLNVTALGGNIPDAIQRAYAAVKKIRFEGAHYRTDIGHKALNHLASR